MDEVHATQPTQTSPEVFGVYNHTNADDPSNVYTVSRTGFIMYPKASALKADPSLKPQVISMVNGSMCVNPLGEFICSVNFDNYVGDVLGDRYRLAREPQVRGKGKKRQVIEGECIIAYFDPDTGTYRPDEPAVAQGAVQRGLPRHLRSKASHC